MNELWSSGPKRTIWSLRQRVGANSARLCVRSGLSRGPVFSFQEVFSMSEPRLRSVTAADAEALLAIYAPYVRETAITFESEVPRLEECRRRIGPIMPFLLRSKLVCTLCV